MLRFRPYRQSDAEEITAWITNEKEFYQWSAGMMGEFPPSIESFNSFHNVFAENGEFYRMVAYKQNELVGYITMRYTDEAKTIVRLGFVLVNPAKRGKGYGVKLLNMAVRYSFDYLDAKKITLAVFENNEKAIKCYLRTGFSRAKTDEKIIYNIKNEIWNCILLELNSLEELNQEAVEIPNGDAYIADLVADNHFRYAFQPIVEASTGDIYGYEALMRGGYDGDVTPYAILQWATRNNRLYEIEKRTFFNILDFVSCHPDEFKGKRIFINSIPGFQLNEEDYRELVTRYGSLFKQMTIEITEAAQLEDEKLAELRERSEKDRFELAIDDYGTGYSNTTNLLRHLPNCVKMDRLLISEINSDTKKQHFVKSMVEFAQENGFAVLAEGVETLAELRTVLQIGVSYIQGYYTGRPSFDVIREIDSNIRNQIINANVRGQTQTNRNIYVVTDEKELPLMRVALEQNTGILISQPEFTLVGNCNYSAAMNVRIKDGCNCRLVLRDVMLESFQDLPCIEIGKNVDLTLVLEGNNLIRKVGICVPESSRVTIVGDGSLGIRVQGIQSYGIGNLWDSVVGDICCNLNGNLDILVEADDGIGIGGGTYKTGEGIRILGGKVNIEAASARTIGIGSVNGSIPIDISNCNLNLDMKIEKGIGIGCLDGDQNTAIHSSSVSIVGSGSFITPIGSMNKSGGTIHIADTNAQIRCNGQWVNLIGTAGGKINVNVEKSSLKLRGEGSEVMGIGSRDYRGLVEMKSTDCNVEILSGGHILFGAKEENIRFEGGKQQYDINA